MYGRCRFFNIKHAKYRTICFLCCDTVFRFRSFRHRRSGGSRFIARIRTSGCQCRQFQRDFTATELLCSFISRYKDNFLSIFLRRHTERKFFQIIICIYFANHQRFFGLIIPSSDIQCIISKTSAAGRTYIDLDIDLIRVQLRTGFYDFEHGVIFSGVVTSGFCGIHRLDYIFCCTVVL